MGDILTGQRALITGASEGIGFGIAQAMLEAGADVMIAARRRSKLESAQQELGALARPNQRVEIVEVDVTQPDSVQKMFEHCDETFGTLNIFVANAGSGSMVPFLEMTEEIWRSTLELNLGGTFRTCQHAARRMVDRADRDANAAILVVSSIRALGTRPGTIHYATTKAGLNQFVRVAAYELAGSGVRINALSPGITATPMALQRNPDVFTEMTATVPMGRAGTPADMGAAAVYLCSPAANFVTGTNHIVDGGESLY
ncbi:SDR family NAD(P)-dependent oxidoreductase [Mycolicibacterium thermoresistibile]|uniref:Glucose 1-dehydrogenase n=2 Tax=Mycolicibacterium thermoresistibile TaxID=1797 RepID=G7CJ82_MYCT3|nr:SDR family oxidoreductase [Mycolicibacterium thermoresistibile]EHI12680.1 glucose 1-dehydrogenase [Mycolicibacterium thermoresistibile ATCC 19527]MCV7190059.1 SDR family oxidoreductase [Mycolicibacterium thermoresistibile]GAT13884.1 glucose 1-dehydrogenase [Mycolicibacterium thermoresistibile]SNW19057.1 Sorbose reductase SOU1 [Mycolicibacterium thermoresistibile]